MEAHAPSVVMSNQELKYINNLKDLAPPRDPNAAKKTLLRTTSQTRYKEWPNTIEALREKKKKDGIKRLQTIEAAQQIIDEQEAKFAEEQRRQAIDRANMLLYKDSERVKALSSAVLISTVMKEREAQHVVKAARAEQEKQIEQMWDSLERQKAYEEEQRDVQKARERQLRTHKMIETQNKQRALLRDIKVQQREQEVVEGELNKRAVLEAQTEAAAAEQRRQQRLKELEAETKRMNQEQLALKAEARKMEALEEEALEAFARQKEAMEQARKERILEVARQKRERYEAMIAKQIKHLGELKAEEEKRTHMQVLELADRQGEEERKKEEKRLKLVSDIARSRTNQMQRKREEKERQAAEDRIMNQQWQERAREQEERELEIKRRTVENAVRLQNLQRQQMLTNEERAIQDKVRELEEAKAAEMAARHDEAVFEEYAHSQMAELERTQRSVVPVQLMLQKMEFKKTHLVPIPK